MYNIAMSNLIMWRDEINNKNILGYMLSGGQLSVMELQNVVKSLTK